MRPCARGSVAALLAALAACAHQRPADAGRLPSAAGALPSPSSDLEVEAAAARNVVATFLAAEAEGAQTGDTLVAAENDFIMQGVRVTTRPRLAGLNGPGTAQIEQASTGASGNVAWVVVSYLFEGRTPDLSERARATFVLEKQRAGWKIRHVHSSMVERW